MELFFNSVEMVYLFFRDIVFWLSVRKHFQNDPPGYEPEKFEKVLQSIQPTLIHETGTHWKMRDTHIFLLHPFDPTKPSITFHHGAGQINHMLPATFILGKKIMDSCNVFVIKAQKHTSTYEYLTEAVDSFLHQQQTFAGSVLATEDIVKYHKKYSKKPIIVSGVSMGGIVASLHAWIFGTGDFYVPITAYPNVGEIFLGQSYRFAISQWDKKRTIQSYLDSYRIDKIPRSLSKHVFPVLGRFDRIVPFDKADKFWKTQGITAKVFPYGHFTSIIARSEIRKMLLSCL